MKNPLKFFKENELHWPIYMPMKDLSWGKRFHLVSLFWMKIYGSKSYLVVGILFLELKLYFAPPLNKLSREEVLKRKQNIFLSYMNRREVADLKTLSKKLKISESSVKHLATTSGYIVENGRITKF